MSQNGFADILCLADARADLDRRIAVFAVCGLYLRNGHRSGIQNSGRLRASIFSEDPGHALFFARMNFI